MEHVLVSFNSVFPLFVMVALGYLLRQKGWWDDAMLSRLNQIAYWVFFSSYLFVSIYKTDLSDMLSPAFLLFALGGVLLLFFIVGFGTGLFIKDKARWGAFAQGMGRSNILMFGLPMIASLWGVDAMGMAAVAVALVVPVYNVLSVIMLEVLRGGRFNMGKILSGIIKNPLILGSVFGFAVLFTGLPIPTALDKVVNDLSRMATPLSLMILGGTFSFSAARANTRLLVTGCLLRLVVIPACAVTAGILFGFRDVELTILLIIFGSPTSASSYILARQMKSDDQLAGQIVVFTTACSAVTLFLWILLLKQSGMM